MQQMTKVLMYGSIHSESGKRKKMKKCRGEKREFRQRDKN